MLLPPGPVAFPRQAKNYSFNSEVDENSVLRPQSNLNLQNNHSTSAKPNALNCRFTIRLNEILRYLAKLHLTFDKVHFRA